MAGSKRGKALRAAIGHLLAAWDKYVSELAVDELANADGGPFGDVRAEVENLRRLLASQLQGRAPDPPAPVIED